MPRLFSGTSARPHGSRSRSPRLTVRNRPYVITKPAELWLSSTATSSRGVTCAQAGLGRPALGRVRQRRGERLVVTGDNRGRHTGKRDGVPRIHDGPRHRPDEVGILRLEGRDRRQGAFRRGTVVVEMTDAGRLRQRDQVAVVIGMVVRQQQVIDRGDAWPRRARPGCGRRSRAPAWPVSTRSVSPAGVT